MRANLHGILATRYSWPVAFTLWIGLIALALALHGTPQVAVGGLIFAYWGVLALFAFPRNEDRDEISTSERMRAAMIRGVAPIAIAGGLVAMVIAIVAFVHEFIDLERGSPVPVDRRDDQQNGSASIEASTTKFGSAGRPPTDRATALQRDGSPSTTWNSSENPSGVKVSR